MPPLNNSNSTVPNPLLSIHLLPDHLQHARQELLALLTAKSFQRGHFVLASGKTASWYLDCRISALSGRGSYLIGQLLYDACLEGLHLDAVGGMALGAAPLVTAVTYRSAERGNPLDGFLVRKEAKAYGQGRQIEGNISPWMRVALVEDVATTGGSTIKAAETLRRLYPNIEIVQVVALVDRQAGAAEAFKQAGLPFRSLYRVDEILAE
ncbi:MAG: orotate phosphoribosyltransferase [Candidatus Melainabacteria bacterium]|nr:orotate phosphoribosyltransferase [Candidatus Melainabacteria bacterium]